MMGRWGDSLRLPDEIDAEIERRVERGGEVARRVHERHAYTMEGEGDISGRPVEGQWKVSGR